MKRIVVVDENDTVLGHKDEESLKSSDIYRVAALWITDTTGKYVFLAKRALDRSHDPGKWGPAAAGTVEEWETYESNVLKEAEEELGLTNIRPVEGPKERVSGEHTFFVQWYLLTLDKSRTHINIDKNEAGEAKWFTREELLKELRESPEEFVASASQWGRLFSGGSFFDNLHFLTK